MQVVSSKFGNNYVYYEAPPAEKLPEYINDFLEWLDTDNNVNPLIKAAIAHLWFITLHPFDDGNGRIARAITELMLSRADKSLYRFYSMSGQILKARNDYYICPARFLRLEMIITEFLNRRRKDLLR